MIRWLWPILAASSFAVSFSALCFDRIGHANAGKSKWVPLGIEIPMLHPGDFFVWALPFVAVGLLGCALLLWLVARHSLYQSTMAYRLPPVGPVATEESAERVADKAIRIFVSGGTTGIGVYALIHLARHFTRQSAFDHSTGQMLHGPGILEHLTHWSLGHDIRYGDINGMTYYAGLQPTLYLVLTLLALGFTIAWLKALLTPRRQAG